MKKTIKRIFASLMVVVMVLTVAPLSGFMGLELPVLFDAKIKASATDNLDNSDAIEIFTAEDLQAINNDLSASYILMNDIDLTEIEDWEPIGDNLVYYYGTKTGSKFSEESENYFSGHFDGNGYKIRGLNIDSCAYTYRSENGKPIDGYGLFAHISRAIIEDLTIENVNINISTKDNYSDTNKCGNQIIYGTLCASAYDSQIIDCRTTSGEIIISDEVDAGGVVGYSFKTDLCNLYNSLSGNLDGGILYTNDDYIRVEGNESAYYSNIQNCINMGDIIGSGISSGFNGYVDNCYNYGKVGRCGIIGMSLRFIEIKNCINYGNIITENAGGIGGIIGATGYDGESTIENCINYGKLFISPSINDTDYIGYTVGGILGDDNYNVIVSDCENYGDITLDLSNALTHGYVAGVASGSICNGILLNFGDIEVVGASYSLYVAGVVSRLYNNKYSEEFNDVLLNNYGDINVKDCNMIETTNGYLSVGGAYSSTDACKSKTINLGNEGNIFVSGDITFARIGGVGGNYSAYYEETMFNAYNRGNISVTDKTDTGSDNLNIGGLFGVCSGTNMLLKDSYTIASITTNKTEYGMAEVFNVGNICGYLPMLTTHTIDNCYVYNTTKTIGAGDNLISENIKFSPITDDFNNFAFENTWILDENGYPKFKNSKVKDLNVPLVLSYCSGKFTNLQKLNFVIAENTGIVAYYFGTNESPAKSDYISVETISYLNLTETIYSPGIYYLFVEDINGNVATFQQNCSNTGVTWTYVDETNTLIISGIGAMEDYESDDRPWEVYEDNITSIIIEDGVTSIGEYAFNSFDSLTSVSMPDSVTSIATAAFRYCTNLESIEIPDSVISIGKNVFQSCKSLTGVRVDSNNQNYSSDEYGVLFNKNKTTLIQYPVGNTRTSYKIPNSVTMIDTLAFANSISLTSVTIEDNLISINTGAFLGCSNLSNITIGDGVTSIGYSAFYNCTNLESVTIPNSVTSIGSNAFWSCKKLKDVIIGRGIATIDENAFAYCTNISDVYYSGSEDQWNDISIGSYNTYLTDATIHYNYIIHNHIYNGVITKPTCTTQGYTTYTCTICSDNYMDNYIAATGHTWAAATCTAKKTCLACGTTSGTVLGHSYTPTVIKVATCTTLGTNKYTCSRCSTSYTETIPATGHSYINNICSACGHRTLLSTEIYKFNNSYSNFGNGKYTMLNSDFNKLINYVEANYSDPQSTINSLQDYRNSSWGGSCYGMSVTVLLDRNGHIAFNENFDSNASTMYDVDKPLDNMAVMSAMNYYQIAQKIPFIKNTSHYYYNDDSNWSRGLKNTVETAKLGEPFLFCYCWKSGDSTYGHAIVIKYCEQRADGGYNLIAYDNRYPTQDVIVAIDKNFETCVTTYYNYQGKKIEEKPYKIEYTTNYSGFDKIDIDGPNNDFNINYGGNTLSTPNVIIEFPATGTVKIENNNGEILTCNNGILTGDMEIISERMIVNSTEFGEADVATVVVEVADSGFFEISSSTNNVDVSILTENTYASANATNANCVVFNENEGVYVLGEDMDYDISLTSNMENTDMISISGESVSDVSLVYENEAIVASGVDGDCCQVTVFSNIVNAEDKRFMSGYGSVKIVSLTEEYGDVDILAVSDDDNIDVSIMIRDEDDNLDTTTGKVNSVSIDDISMNYKDSATIVPNIVVDEGVEYTVTYSSSDEGVVSVDENGNITTNGKGSATITVTVTDEYGNKVTDTCDVNAQYTWWQWIIVIVLFGWIWY